MRVGAYIKDFVVSSFIEYDTPKIVHIQSPFIGILNRLVQIVIIVYLIVWVFILNYGYQYIDQGGISGSTSKLKGVAYTNSTDPRVGTRIWDGTDLVIPPKENNAFFVTTNVITTHNQTHGVCPEKKENKSGCKNDTECLPENTPFHLGHGVTTGKCNKETGTCMVKAWCPIEDDKLPNNGSSSVLEMTKDFTVLIKNHVYFPHYNRTRSNLIEFIDKSYIRSCNYHPVKQPYCPVFRLGDIVALAGSRHPEQDPDDQLFKQMAIKGGVIAVGIKWDCDFDYDETECKPTYKFDRLDNYEGNSVASGYNFRYALNFMEGDVQKRTLVKAFGILFVLTTEARARAFDIIETLKNVGSGLALLGIASVLCDIFLLNIHRRKTYYKEQVYHNVVKQERQGEKTYNPFLLRKRNNVHKQNGTVGHSRVAITEDHKDILNESEY